MGFKNIEAVRLFGYGGSVLPETDIHLLADDLPEQPLWRDGDNLFFYAKGPVDWKRIGNGFVHTVNTYSDYGYYFLTDDADGAKAQFGKVESDSISGTLVEQYPDFMVYDPDEFSWYRSGRRMFESYDYAAGNGRNYSFNIPGICGDSVMMNIAFSTSSNQASQLTVSVNGTETGTIRLPANTISEESAVVKEGTMLSRGSFTDDTRIRLVHDAPSGAQAPLNSGLCGTSAVPHLFTGR